MRAADAIVALLEEAGVAVAFGIPGVHNLSLFDALSRSSIRTVVTRHEGAAAHAADGYARATGRAGVVVTTTGPGAANALAGIGEAWAASSPVLHLTTQVAADVVEAGVQRGILHQSPGQMEAFAPISGFARRVRDAASAAAVVAEALAATVHGRWRPAYVEVPHDVLDAPATAASPLEPSAPAAGASEEIERSAAILAEASDAVVWAGGGVVQSGPTAVDALARVAHRLAAPVVTTYMGRAAVSSDDPLALGLPPHEPAVQELLEEAGALLAVGTDFGATTTMGGILRLPERIVHINLEAEEVGKQYAATALVGDAGSCLQALDAELAQRGVDRSGRVARTAGRVAAVRDAVWSEIRGDARTSEAARLVAGLGGALPPEAIVVCDMCVAGYWCGGYLPRSRPRTLLYPLGWGTLGWSLPAAIGAATAGQGPVLAVVGDAGLMYYPGELATAQEQDLDVTVLVVNDGGYGMLRFDEERRFGRTFAADLLTPDLRALAGAFDLPYALAHDVGEVEPAVRRAIGGGGPHMIELRAALYPPRTTSPRWREPG